MKENIENIKYTTESRDNIENVVYSQCVSCVSSSNSNCTTISDVDGLLKQCKGIYSYEKSGCYTMFKSKLFHLQFVQLKNYNLFLHYFSDGTVHRGCTKDLSTSDHDDCKKKENCNLCTGNGCNIDATGSSGRITASAVVMAFIISIIFLCKNE